MPEKQRGKFESKKSKEKFVLWLGLDPWYTLVFPFVDKLLMIIKQRKIPDCTPDKMFEP